MSLGSHAHTGSAVTLSWRTTIAMGTRVDVGEGTRHRAADILRQVGAGDRLLVVCQPQGQALAEELVSGFIRQGFQPTVHTVPDGEGSKDIKELIAIWDILQDNRFERRDSIVAVGGGAVCDVAGFAASTYLRGLNLLLVPTTLLAQVDAAIGGKTAVNLAAGKNLAGTFYFPGAVIVDPSVLATLPERQFRSGLAEIIKYALIEQTVAEKTEYRVGPRPLLDVLQYNLKESFSYDDPVLPGIVMSCIKMKLLVVGKDPHEKGLRRCLNLGHTLGHALEKASGYTLAHGEAVSIGCIFAVSLAVKRKLLELEDLETVKNLALRAGLPVEMPPALERERIMEAMAHDKKRYGTAVKFVLPKTRLGLVDFDAGVELKELSSLILP